MLASRRGFEGTNVLDLYAGSGALGFEALSRGARFARFVERDAAARHCIASNAESLGVTNDVSISADDVVSYLRSVASGTGRDERFDVVFADPPYGIGVESLPGLVAPVLKPDGFLVVEHDPTTSFDDRGDLITTRRFGRTLVSLFGGTPEV